MAGCPTIDDEKRPSQVTPKIVAEACADLDLDGVDDLVIADSSSPVITLLLSDGNTGLAYVAGPDTGASNTAVAAADLNDDAVPDLVVGDENGDVRFYFANP